MASIPWPEWSEPRDTEPGCDETRPNDPCPCESGLTFGECHGAEYEGEPSCKVEAVAEYVNEGKP